MTTQIALRLDDELVSALDELVDARDDLSSRSSAIRIAVRELVERLRREELDRAIVDGYRRIPPGTPDEWGALETEAATSASIMAARLDAEDGGW